MADLQSLVEQVETLIRSRDAAALVRVLRPLHASDIADVVEALDADDDRAYLLDALPAARASATLAEMDEESEPEELLASFREDRITAIVATLDDDDAADLIGELEPADQARVLAALPSEDASELRDLLRYPEESAGGLMTTDLVVVDDGVTVAQAIDAVREQSRDLGEFYTVFVTGPGRRLRGTLPFRTLVTAEPGQAIAPLVEPIVATVGPETDQEEVSRLLSRYNLVALPVVDADGCLLGLVSFDDVIDVIEAESTEDILRFAGTSEEEELGGRWQEAVRSRLPWLGVNLVTAFLAAAVVLRFSRTVDALPVLVPWMPVVAGMGGNAGTQALAVTVRRLATRGEERRGERWRVVGKEVIVGLVNGLTIGLAVLIVSLLFDQGPRIAFVVLAAMWANLAVAGFAGAFVPTLLARLGADPAVASSIFVTTFTDICGFAMLLGLATRLLL